MTTLERWGEPAVKAFLVIAPALLVLGLVGDLLGAPIVSKTSALAAVGTLVVVYGVLGLLAVARDLFS